MAQPTTYQPALSDLDQHDYNFSGAIYDDSTDNAPSTDDEALLDHHSILPSTPSRHSSVSSFPASVLHHTPTYNSMTTPSRSPFHNTRIMSPSHPPRPHSTGFRHPSSVRALQMQDEFETTDGEDLGYGHRRRNSKLSYLSYRSSGSYHSSPTKSLRTGRSAHTSPNKTRLKQEFPLVLLHCTLLPPALHMRAQQLKSETSEKDSVMEAIVPEPYVQRWKTLQDKVVKNSEVKLRGILIPHPGDDYEMLEERLLESLELERPRIREGHYLSKDRADSSADSGFESGGTDSDSQHDVDTTENQPSNQCPDCGHHLSSGVEQERKWDIKVFAANGLMRAGAWNAAWNEMEKVDVEVSIWMPEDVRREVDERLNALITKQLEEDTRRDDARGLDAERAQEIYGAGHEVKDQSAIKSQAEIDGLADEPDHTPNHHHNHKSTVSPNPIVETGIHLEPTASALLSNYVQLLLQDRRNIAIVLLSVLVLYYGLSGANHVFPTGHVEPPTDAPAAEIAQSTVSASTTTELNMLHTVSELAAATSHYTAEAPIGVAEAEQFGETQTVLADTSPEYTQESQQTRLGRESKSMPNEESRTEMHEPEQQWPPDFTDDLSKSEEDDELTVMPEQQSQHSMQDEL